MSAGSESRFPYTGTMTDQRIAFVAVTASMPP